MTLAGKEKQGHCQLSLGDYEAKLNAMAVLALVEGCDPMVQSHRTNLQHYSVFRQRKNVQIRAVINWPKLWRCNNSTYLSDQSVESVESDIIIVLSTIRIINANQILVQYLPPLDYCTEFPHTCRTVHWEMAAGISIPHFGEHLALTLFLLGYILCSCKHADIR